MDIAATLEAASKLAWPILAAVVLWRLYPSIRKIIESRGFTVKIGEMEVTVQEASDQLRTQVEDLQEKVSALRQQMEGQAQPVAATALLGEPAEVQPIERILWVDDNPEDNAYEIAKLRNDGYQIVQAVSTDSAMHVLLSGRLGVDAVISDMGRHEGGQHQPRAGLNFIKEAREAGVQVPIFIYASPGAIERNQEELLDAGGNGATSSALELFELIRSYDSGRQS
jgi:CheY-like chemotaxis protein